MDRDPVSDGSRSDRIAFRLGMTRGAFFAFLFIYAVTVGSLWWLGDVNQSTRRTAKRNKTTIDQLAVAQETIALQQQQLVQLAADGAEAHAALCVFRSDLKTRVDQGRRSLAFTLKLVREHPEGILGLDKATTARIVKDAKTQQQGRIQTLATLSGLDCS